MNTRGNNHHLSLSIGIQNRRPRYILFWNKAYGGTKYGFCCGKAPFLECQVKDCYITDDRSALTSVDKFDLIQFHQRSLTSQDLPEKRSPHQRYMMWYMESASYPFGFKRYVNICGGIH